MKELKLPAIDKDLNRSLTQEIAVLMDSGIEEPSAVVERLSEDHDLFPNLWRAYITKVAEHMYRADLPQLSEAFTNLFSVLNTVCFDGALEPHVVKVVPYIGEKWGLIREIAYNEKDRIIRLQKLDRVRMVENLYQVMESDEGCSARGRWRRA